jgi:capsular polysaccharide biosynthesis protein
MKERNVEDGVYEIDLLRILKVLWSHAWIIVISTLLVGALAFSYARFFVEPTYQAKALMYVNNKSISVGSTGVTFSAGELNAAKSLVDTYTVILKTRTTLNAVIRKTGVNYTYEQLNKMVRAAAVNDTEIFAIIVTSTSPQEAELLANAIADILPAKIGDVVEGSSVSVVDRAVVPNHRVAPSHSKYTAVGLLVGFLISCLAVILADLFDDVIRGDDYLTQTYDVPVLGIIPDLSVQGGEKTGYGYGTRARRQ